MAALSTTEVATPRGPQPVLSIPPDATAEAFASASRSAFASGSTAVSLITAEPWMPGGVTDWIALNAPGFSLHGHRTDESGTLWTYQRDPKRAHDLLGKLVVTLTSYPARFGTLHLTLARLLAQSVRPDEVVLWVAHEDAEALPCAVTAMAESGLTIRFTEDLRSYKKVIPALAEFGDSFLLTVDDDQIYPLDLIETLVAGYRGDREVLCRRAHRLEFGTSTIAPYMSWPMNLPEGSVGDDVFATGCGGVLDPPGALPAGAVDSTTFLRLAPGADDLWLHWMVHINGWTTRVVGPTWPNQTWQGSQENSLMSENWAGGNDRQIAALVAELGLPHSHRAALEIAGVGYHACLAHPGDHIQSHMATGTPYEVDMIIDMAAEIATGDTVIDVGANIGNHTLALAAVGAAVVAFEPNPLLAAALRQSIVTNGWDHQVVVLEAGVGAVEGRGVMRDSNPENLGSQRIALAEGGGFPIVALDHLPLPDRVAMVKIDVEGMEPAVLDGAVALLTRDHPVLYVEAAGPAEYELVEQRLVPLGYRQTAVFNATPTYKFVWDGRD